MNTRLAASRAWWLLAVAVGSVVAVLPPPPASAHSDQWQQQTVRLATRDGQCTDAYGYHDHTTAVAQAISKVDGWSDLGPFAPCRNYAGRPPGNIRLAVNFFTNGYGPCGIGNPIGGLNNDGRYWTNTATVGRLQLTFSGGHDDLWLKCNRGWLQPNWLTMDVWANIHSWRGAPPAWIGGDVRPITGHWYPVPFTSGWY